METLQTYINTKEISRILINTRNQNAAFHFFRVTLSDICMKNSPWQICPIIFIKIWRNLHLQYVGGGTQIGN